MTTHPIELHMTTAAAWRLDAQKALAAVGLIREDG